MVDAGVHDSVTTQADREAPAAGVANDGAGGAFSHVVCTVGDAHAQLVSPVGVATRTSDATTPDDG